MNTRKEEALEHHNYILETDKGEIKKSIEGSVIYDSSILKFPHVKILNTDCLSAAIQKYEESNIPSDKITILNFASFTKPGGGFINGALAQEEYLCKESNLYEILSDDFFESYYNENKKDMNNGLYHHKAIFTPNVKFHRNGKEYFFNVLTCASPNYKVAIEKNVKESNILNEYAERVEMLYKILEAENQHLFISGAWGCGVFGFPREESTNIFISYSTIDTILAYPSSSKFQNKRSNED